MTGTIKYAIADDHKIFRQGLKFALAIDTKLRLVCEAENGRELLESIKHYKPDVVLLDLKMPEMDGLEATKLIHSAYRKVKILILTSYSDEHFIMHLLESGANGYLLKNADPEEIKKAIHTVFEHDYYFNNIVSNTMLKSITKKNKASFKFNEGITLNERETEVLTLLCQELTNAEIAEKLFLSARTVEGLRQTLIGKIGVRNTVGLVIYALRNNMI